MGSIIISDVVSWNNKNRFTIKPHKLHLRHYWTPLYVQFKSPAPLQPPIPPETLNHITNTPSNTVSFQLPRHHINKYSTAWRRSPRSRSRYTRRREENSNQKHTRRAKPLTEAQVKRGVLNVAILSAISNTGATSSVGLVSNPYIPTGIKSTKLFHVPNGSTAPASDVCKLEHKLRDPARTVDIFPGLVNASLLSTSKLASAGYITVYDGKEVNLYDSSTAKIIVSAEAVLKG